MSYSPLTPLLLLPYSTLAMIRGDKGREKTKYPHAHHHVYGCWTAGVPPAQKKATDFPTEKNGPPASRRHKEGLSTSRRHKNYTLKIEQAGCGTATPTAILWSVFVVGGKKKHFRPRSINQTIFRTSNVI